MNNNPFDFAGKVALVTGAGRGIGRSVAILLAQGGAKVTVVSRTQEELDEVLAQIESSGSSGLAICQDMSHPDAARNISEKSWDKFGQLDILINNAGMVLRKRAEETMPEDWDAILNLNLKALAEVCRLCLPHLRKSAGANIVNMSSITGPFVGMELRAAYASTKAAILGYTRVLAKELASEKIRVNAVSPGVIDTEFVRPQLQQNPELMDNVISRVPLGCMGTPEEIAWPMLFLASSAASYITGQTIVIDGGWTLR